MINALNKLFRRENLSESNVTNGSPQITQSAAVQITKEEERLAQEKQEQEKIAAENAEKERKAKEVKALKFKMMQESLKAGNARPAFEIYEKCSYEIKYFAEKIDKYFSKKPFVEDYTLNLKNVNEESSATYYRYFTLGKFGPSLVNNALKIEKLVKAREEALAGLDHLVNSDLTMGILGKSTGTVTPETYHILKSAIIAKYDPQVLSLCKESDKITTAIVVPEVKELECKIRQKFNALVTSQDRSLTRDEYKSFIRGYKMHRRGYDLPWGLRN